MRKLILILISALGLMASASKGADWYNAEWFKLPVIKALGYYSKVRKYLHDHNLHAPNEGLQREQPCTTKEIRFRTAIGDCNDQKLSLMGAAHTRFSRLTEDWKRNLSDSPDPRILSRQLFTREEFKTTINSNFISSAFLQFVLHDWFAHEQDYTNLVSIDLEPDDPIRSNYGQKKMYLTSSVNVGTDQVKEYRNEVTHWFDASQVYGSDLETQNSLRTFIDGQLILHNNLLPVSNDGKELTGNTRNWWIGLSVIHNLFAREHNEITRALKLEYPKMSDEELFQTARLINSAQITKIFLTEQVLPRLVNKNFHLINLANWYGLANGLIHFKKLGEHIPMENIGYAKFEPGWEKIIKILNIPELTGLIGSKKNLRNTAFAMTEEWAQVYRYHTIIPDYLKLSDEKIPLENSRGAAARRLIEDKGLAHILKGMGDQFGGSAALNNYPKFLQELDIPILGRVDLGTADIYRERERNIPPFNQMRRLLGLPAFKDFSEITSDQKINEKLRRLYNGDIETIDMTVGVLAENHGEGLELGETTVQILTLLASRRIESDRFYTNDFNARTYTQLGINWINKSTFKGILLRNIPELAEELKDVVNPLMVWSKTKMTTKQVNK